MPYDRDELEDDGFGETSRYAAHLDRGWSLLEKSELSAARASAEQARELRPEAPDASVLLGAIALAEGDAEESLRCYDVAIELDPDYLEPYAAAAQVCLFDLGDALRALQYCEDALELDSLESLDALDLELLAAEAESQLGKHQAVHKRLSNMDELDELTRMLDPEGVPADASNTSESIGDAQVAHDTELAHDAETMDAEEDQPDEEDAAEQLQRGLHLSLRLARLWLDFGMASSALELLRTVVRRFANEADAWYLLTEAENHGGDARSACHAALRTYRLDAQMRIPKWAPTPALLHRRVVQILNECSDPTLHALVERRAGLVVLIHDSPSLELVLEGVDPRIPALSLAVRPAHDESSSDEDNQPSLTGIAIYRRNLLRVVRDEEQFDEELRYAVLDELAAFHQLDSERRRRLQLAPIDPPQPTQKTRGSAYPRGEHVEAIATQEETSAETGSARRAKRRRKPMLS